MGKIYLIYCQLKLICVSRNKVNIKTTTFSHPSFSVFFKAQFYPVPFPWVVQKLCSVHKSSSLLLLPPHFSPVYSCGLSTMQTSLRKYSTAPAWSPVWSSVWVSAPTNLPMSFFLCTLSLILSSHIYVTHLWNRYVCVLLSNELIVAHDLIEFFKSYPLLLKPIKPLACLLTSFSN